MAQEGVTPPDLRPLGVGEMLDVSIKVYTRNLWTFMGIVAIIYVPIGIIAILGFISLVPDGAVVRDGELYFPAGESVTGFNAFLFLLIGLAFLGTLLSAGVGTKAVADAYLGRKPSAGESYSYVGRRFHSLIWLSLLLVVIIVLGTIALIVPGIYLAVSLSVAVPVLVVEGAKGTKALSRSFNLVQGRWWPTFAVILLGGILIPFVIRFALGFIFGLALEAQGTDDPSTHLVLSQIVGTIGSIVSAPIQVAVLTILYFDLRVRKEGFDLQLLTERIQGPPGPHLPQVAEPPVAPSSSGPPPPSS